MSTALWRDAGSALGPLNDISVLLLVGESAAALAAVARGVASAVPSTRRIAVFDLAGAFGLGDADGLVRALREGRSLNALARPLDDGEHDRFVVRRGPGTLDATVTGNERWPRLVLGFRSAGALLVIAAPADGNGALALAPHTDVALRLVAGTNGVWLEPFGIESAALPSRGTAAGRALREAPIAEEAPADAITIQATPLSHADHAASDETLVPPSHAELAVEADRETEPVEESVVESGVEPAAEPPGTPADAQVSGSAAKPPREPAAAVADAPLEGGWIAAVPQPPPAPPEPARTTPTGGAGAIPVRTTPTNPTHQVRITPVSSRQTPARRFPWVLAITVVVLAAAGWYYMETRPAPNRQVTEHADSLDALPPSRTALPDTVAVPEVANPGAANRAAEWGVALLATNDGRYANLRLADQRALQAGTISPVMLGDGSALMYKIVVGAYSDRSTAEIVRATLRQVGSIDHDAGLVVRVPYAVRLDTGLTADGAKSRVESYVARGIAAYALMDNARASVYAGAFASPQESVVLLAELRAAGLEPHLAFRVGRSY